MMIPPTLECARAMRDAGIDAMAALDSGLPAALAGLSEENSIALRRSVGQIMGEVVDRLINPSVRAFPELATDKAAWVTIAKERAVARAAFAINT